MPTSVGIVPAMTSRASLSGGALVFLLVSLLVSAPSASLPPVNAVSTVVVTMPNGAGDPSGAPGYSPDTITVVIGANNTVTWENSDPTVHTVTSWSVPAGAAEFDSGYIQSNGVYTQTFTIPGAYQYHCTLHTWMSGTVLVKAGSTTTTPEFPAASLALITFGIIAAAAIAGSLLRTKGNTRPGAGDAKRPASVALETPRPITP